MVFTMKYGGVLQNVPKITGTLILQFIYYDHDLLLTLTYYTLSHSSHPLGCPPRCHDAQRVPDYDQVAFYSWSSPSDVIHGKKSMK